METRIVATRGYDDQRPGTAGLRKKVAVFQQPDYLECFLQAILVAGGPFEGETLVAGGDGRFFNREALQRLAGVAAGNGVARLIIGRSGLLSTPAASNLIRRREAAGGFILSASHNPGGPDGDFGVKFNTANGGQASESLMDAVFAATRDIESYRTIDLGPIDLETEGVRVYGPLTVEVVDPVSDYAALMERLFDFGRIRDLLSSDGFRMRFDAMHAITGPYAVEILENRLGAPQGTVVNAVPLEDFGGGHPDPNPVDAAELVALMNGSDAPDFAAASDGDGDRNMIVGRGLVVSPGDSLAVLAANHGLVPGYRDGLAGVARSMPTSRAVDRVAEALDLPCHETPTGWRFFCNLLDDGQIDLCGEESFGTSSSHAREKDGLWAVLYWLNLLAVTGRSVAGIIEDHWLRFGRNVFSRNDYFIPDAARGQAVMERLNEHLTSLAGQTVGGREIASADSFTYRDPVDGSESPNQGIRVFLGDGSRIVYRLSGTGTAGATLRVYLERLLPGDEAAGDAASLTAELGAVSREIAAIEPLTGLTEPTGII